jgi:hypothetical protein
MKVFLFQILLISVRAINYCYQGFQFRMANLILALILGFNRVGINFLWLYLLGYFTLLEVGILLVFNKKDRVKYYQAGLEVIQMIEEKIEELRCNKNKE